MHQPTPYHPHYQTILSTPSQISTTHPLFYYKQKNYFLQQLSNKVSIQTKFNSMDLKRNVRIDHLINRHDQIQKNVKKQIKKRNMFLNTEQFRPIQVGQFTKQQNKISKQRKQAHMLRQQLYKSYIEECQMHQAPQNDTIINQDTYQLAKITKKLTPGFTLLTSAQSDPLKRKQLYLLDIQIQKLRQQQLVESQVQSKLTSCTNNRLLQKMSNGIMSAYMVYFDQIFDSLMDQLLEEEVIYFNALQANYYINNQSKNINNTNKDFAKDVKAQKMKELVKQLDQLAFD